MQALATVLLQLELDDVTGALVPLHPQGGVHHGEGQGPSNCQGSPLLGDLVPCRQVSIEVVLPVEEGGHVDVAPQGHAGQDTSLHTPSEVGGILEMEKGTFIKKKVQKIF